MANTAVSGLGVMAAMRARAGGLVRLLLAALLLQFAGPGPFTGSHAAGDTIVICSEGGIHHVHADGTPADAPADDDHGHGGDCCALGCHLLGMLLPGLATTVATTAWVRQVAAIGAAGRPHPVLRHSFDARGPPSLA